MRRRGSWAGNGICCLAHNGAEVTVIRDPDGGVGHAQVCSRDGLPPRLTADMDLTYWIGA